jgi:hypothetical protein
MNFGIIEGVPVIRSNIVKTFLERLNNISVAGELPFYLL